MDLHENKMMEGERLFSGKRLDEALVIFDSVLREDPENLAALNDKGVVLNGLGRFEDAVSVFSDIVERDPGQPNVIFNLISNCLSLSRWQEAERYLSHFIELLPPADIEILGAEIFEMKFRSSSDKSHLIHMPLSLRIHSHDHDLRLFLDTHQYTQKILWDHISQNQVYEGETLQFLAEVLNPGDCFIDIGAHIGYFSLITSRIVGDDGRVIAVEPHPCNCIHFSKHLSINAIRNIRLIRAVAGAEKGEAEFFYNSDNDGGHALWDPGLHPFNRNSREKPIARKTSMITLDELIEDTAGAVKAIKIDTEGAEMEVLRGGARCLREFQVPCVICEINHFGLHQMGSSEREVRNLMNGLGYDTYLMQAHHPTLLRLQREQFIDPPYVFNLLFRKEFTSR